MDAIKTSTKYNFTDAANDTFSWTTFDGCNGGMLTHKPSGRQIYQMRWIDANGYATETVTGEIREQATEFWAQLRTLQAQKPPRRDEYTDPEPAHGQNGYCRKCHSYCWGDCEA